MKKDTQDAAAVMELNTYDETPYQSFPYSQSRPERLATLATLFGMTPPNFETARVLELGCASGGNLIPHAVHYPKGHYVGVDLSKVQIDAGLAEIKALGLKNIELKHCSITDIDASFGKFDYIICHGVLSWVPDFVRDKIFEIANKNLTENGVAYISYNTLPGWNMVRTIRDMMLYHAQRFEKAADKVAQARALLAFVQESLKDADTPYAKFLTQETELLSKQGDHYLRHDHLEEENKQYYFHEFMEAAAKNNMQYLGDVSLSSMYLGNMGSAVAEKLQGINDIVRTEQYMDFITNRRFRSTLLCHQGVKLNRALSNPDIKKFALSLDIVPEKPLNEVDLEDNSVLKFFFKGKQDQHISTSSPWLKAALYVFVENKGYPLQFETIVKKANKKFSANRIAQVEADLLNNALNLVIKGYMEIALSEKDREQLKLDKPAVSPLILKQSENLGTNWVTSLYHEPIGVNAFDKIAMKYMDGKNNKKQILDLLVEDAKNNKITLNKGDKKVEDLAQIKKDLEMHLDNTIAKISIQGILQ
jgi:methyltransferase-like protein/2-polyprenyl-3-methyl-5-hydroxy-6-metoxy-1,4-benzoquinol methylase